MFLHADSEDCSDWADEKRSFCWFCHEAAHIIRLDDRTETTIEKSSPQTGNETKMLKTQSPKSNKKEGGKKLSQLLDYRSMR